VRKAFFSKEELNNDLEALKEISDEPLCPRIFNRTGQNNWKRKRHTEIPFNGGIYVFWWKGEIKRFREVVLQNTMILQGKKVGDSYEKVEINYTQEWLDAIIINDAVCLYVGKSTNIPKRITGHIRPTTKGRLTGDINEVEDKLKKPNTVSQLRIGLERLFPNVQDVRPDIMKHVHLSYYNLDGYDKSITRFFLEDLAIGTFCPLLNVDIER